MSANPAWVYATRKFHFLIPHNSDTRVRFVTAGVIFLTGALGIEMLGAREADLYDTTTVTYCLLYSLEEMLEMLGIILFIYALLSHLAQETGRLSVVLQLAHGGPTPAGADDDAQER